MRMFAQVRRFTEGVALMGRRIGDSEVLWAARVSGFGRLKGLDVADVLKALGSVEQPPADAS